MFSPNKKNTSLPAQPDISQFRFAIVASEYNAKISDALLNGAIECLHLHNVTENNITVIRVPGAFEIPITAQRLAVTNNYSAIICLGAVIRGETAHFEYVAGECARGIQDVALKTSVPVIFGVLATHTLKQAQARAKNNDSNKGREAARAAIAMAALFNRLP